MRAVVPLGSVCALLVVTACVKLGPSTDLSRFFVLTPEPAAPSAPAGDGPIVAVGPVTLPAYLDRNVLVTRVGPNEVRPAASDWWAEPLAAQVPAVLARNLAGRIGAGRAETWPWPVGLEPDVAVRAVFTHFETDDGGVAHLEAQWWATADGAERAGTTAITDPVAAPTTEAEVAALSRLLGRLADEIAAAVSG